MVQVAAKPRSYAGVAAAITSTSLMRPYWGASPKSHALPPLLMIGTQTVLQSRMSPRGG